MRSLLLLLVVVIIGVGVAFFFKGQANAVKLDHICGKQVPWYEAVFLDEVEGKDSCDKYH